MKKLIAVLALSISAVSFAHGNPGDESRRSGYGNEFKPEVMMEDQINKFTPEQQKEFQEIRDRYRKGEQKLVMNMKETDLDIEKEMMEDKINLKKVDNLTNRKFLLKAQMEKNMYRYKIEIKEKFGIDFMGPLGKRGNINGKK